MKLRATKTIVGKNMSFQEKASEKRSSALLVGDIPPPLHYSQKKRNNAVLLQLVYMTCETIFYELALGRDVLPLSVNS